MVPRVGAEFGVGLLLYEWWSPFYMLYLVRNGKVADIWIQFWIWILSFKRKIQFNKIKQFYQFSPNNGKNWWCSLKVQINITFHERNMNFALIFVSKWIGPGLEPWISVTEGRTRIRSKECRMNPLWNSGYTPSWQLRLRRTDTGRMDDANYENFYERERESLNTYQQLRQRSTMNCPLGTENTEQCQKIHGRIKIFLVQFSMICHLVVTEICNRDRFSLG